MVVIFLMFNRLLHQRQNRNFSVVPLSGSRWNKVTDFFFLESYEASYPLGLRQSVPN
jgi:hypothetical protein